MIYSIIQLKAFIILTINKLEIFMAILFSFSYQGKIHELNLKETNNLDKDILIGGRNYKILGSEESISLLKDNISTLEFSLGNSQKFKASILENVGFQSKIKPVAADILSAAFIEKPNASEGNVSLKEEINLFLENAVKNQNFSGAVLVIKDGIEILKQGYAPEGLPKLTNQTTFHIASITKSFTAVMIMELHQQKKLDIEDPINKLLPEKFRCDEWNDIKVKNLLSHTSGIPSFGPDEGEQQKEYKLDEIIQIVNDKYMEHKYKHMELDVKPPPPPGKEYEYSNSNYVLLGSIIEKIYADISFAEKKIYTDKSFAECIKDRIIDRFEMESTGFGNTYSKETAAQGYKVKANESNEKESLVPVENPESYLSKAHAGGALYSNLDDLQKFDAALNDDSFLTPETRKLMFEASYSDTYDGDLPTEVRGFGFKIWKEDTDLGFIVAKEGKIEGFNTIIQRYVDPHSLKSHSCIIVLSNNGSLNAEEEIARKIEPMLAKHLKK